MLPALFAGVVYVGSRIPDGYHALAEGANCQRYAYAVLAHFGIQLPPWRSSELWEDKSLTKVVGKDFQPLDLMLFAPDDNPFGAHVGLYAGNGLVLHLCKVAERPAEWPLDQFGSVPSYRTLIGGKRPTLKRKAPE